jgi:hypothetical protein
MFLPLPSLFPFSFQIAMLVTVAAIGGARGRHVREGEGTKVQSSDSREGRYSLEKEGSHDHEEGEPVRRRKPRLSEGGTTMTGKVLPSIEKESKTLRGGKPRPREGRREYEM